jgi:hypothetical protein
MAKHVSFTNRDFVEQQPQFGVTISSNGQVFEIFRRTSQLQRNHAARAARGQEIEFFFSMINPRNPIDEIADFLKSRIARVLFQGRGRFRFCDFNGHCLISC